MNPPRETLWPRIDDVRHGAAAGQRFFPQFKDATDAEFRQHALTDSYGVSLFEGVDPSIPKTKLLDENALGEQAPMWRALDVRYDQCVGNCECLPERDMPNAYYSVHYSCLQGINKPQSFLTEMALADALRKMLSCTR